MSAFGGEEDEIRRLVIDCDPGHDDAIAILVALAQPRWRVDGITVVAGNQTLDKTVRNALQVLTVAGRTHVPVYAGMDRPLVRDLVTAEHVHGESGLEGPALPEPGVKAQPEHAVDWLARHLREAGAPIDVAAVGPLTNLALVLRREPDLARSIGRLVVMGGAVGEGNITPSAEFNIFVDPEAAAIVFGAGIPLTMVGLDVTHQALLPRAEFAAIRALGGPVPEMVADLLDYFAGFHQQVYAFDGVPIHDACAVAALFEPTLLTTRRLRVDVETRGQFTDGRTVCDLWGVTGRQPNAEVAVGIDRDGFLDLLTASLRRLATPPALA